ncbi:hypothetical protein FA95DRAFT_1483178 [Auriscalpium vulgare]|uniref:Uncharacterized protein n=1 Tax=Auriscalpium vulgare TaxID=40419 RepID=A0ACB8S9N8_9AGAM|nr:hypothetical protein FA95DRAFT_1483178 [Auriscalpium vulgare]
MKALRKSLNASKDPHHHQISTPLPPVSRPPAAVVPPQKVIRALGPYRSNAPQELSFQKGDFFYVIREVNERGSWYEAHNPMTGARGLVPRAQFEEFNKGAAPNGRMSQALSAAPISSPSLRSPDPRTQVFYAVVMHDFVAERTDELDAKAGDPISVVAQSNREWFVAKPIGRLGKPGLIPVSFVQIRDPVSNQPISDIGPLMDNGSLPRVEDWKKQMLNYKANSIALGILEDSPTTASVTNSPFMPSSLPPATAPTPPTAPAPPSDETSPRSLQEQQQAAAESSPDHPQLPSILPEGLLLSADVVSFHFEMDEYWFRIHALYQPYAPPDSSDLPDALELVLFRAYNDFFDYQTTLLDTFPREAGREGGQQRILPFMPGPAAEVDDQLTATRREELGEYLHQLARLNRTTARFIVEHELTRSFLATKPGDVERPAEPQYDKMEEAGWYEPTEEPVPVGQAEKNVEQRINEGVQFVKINPTGGPLDSDGSDYGEDEPTQTHKQRAPPASNGHLQPTPSTLRGPSSDSRARGHAPHPSYSKNHDAEPYRDSAYSRSSTSSSSRWPENSRSSHHTQATSPISQSRSSVADSSRSRSRSHSLASPNQPPISASNPQTAFIKIKIFDRVQDDLIAIRVHPRVTHEQLMDKVQQRLGGKVLRLSYRESVGGGDDFVPLERDNEVLSWLASTDKHVLYAD